MKCLSFLGLLLVGLWSGGMAQHPLDKILVEFSPGKYMAPDEVSNADYQEFRDKNSEMEGMALDTSIWFNFSGENSAYAKSYHRHPAFLSYPVMNISREQAEAYCAWLTVHYNAHAERKHPKVVIRLPTEAEWELAASAGQDVIYPWQTNAKKRFRESPPGTRRSQMMANFYLVDQRTVFRSPEGLVFKRKINVPRKPSEIYQTPFPARQGVANGLGLYNMAGNAAEMVQEAGIAKGGSWYHPAGHLGIQEQLAYDQPTPWLGFRFMMEVVEI